MSTRDNSNEWLDVTALGVTWLDPIARTRPSTDTRSLRWRLLPSDKGWDLMIRIAVADGADSHDKR